jgi:predicted nucleic acid-binding protein
MKGLIIDTGVFYALLDKSDTYHQRSQAELKLVIQQDLTLYVSFPVWTYDHHFDIMGVSVWRFS